MNSEIRSPIISEVTFVLALIQLTIIDASATVNPSIPCTLPY